MRPVSLLRASVLGLCLPGCAQVLGLDAFDQLAEGAACGQLVGSWECGPGLQCHDVQKVCVKVGAGGNGGGGAGGCEVGTSEACYTGPAGTEEVGDCHGGTRTCETGGVWGACTGEVKPGTESCTLPGDEDCDGQSNEEGADCTCVPGDMAPCYTGPMGTEGVGECKGGMGVCAASGTGVESCAGDVVPVQETCNDTRDEDCNGFACGVVSWVKFVPGMSAQAVGADAAGNIYVGGSFNTPVDFGGGTEIPVGDTAFVVKYDPQGNFIWVSTADALFDSMKVSTDGEVFLAGTLFEAADFGCGLVSPEGPSDGFVAKLGTDGVCGWTTLFKGVGDASARSLSISPTGPVRTIVEFFGVLENAPFVAMTPSTIVARLDPVTGAVMKFVDTGNTAVDLAHDPTGNYGVVVQCGAGCSGVLRVGGVNDVVGGQVTAAAAEWFNPSLAMFSDGTLAVSSWALQGTTVGDCLNHTAQSGADVIVEYVNAFGQCSGGLPLGVSSDTRLPSMIADANDRA